MWGTNSLSQRYQSNNRLPFELGRNALIQNQTNLNYSNPNELNLFIQTPMKQLENIQNNVNNNYNNITPFRFDFNHYFGNLWSSGQIPNNQLIEHNLNLSPTQLNKENLFFYKKSIEKSYKLTPISQLKDNSNSQNNSGNSLNNYNNNNIIINQNNINIDNNNKIIEQQNSDESNEMNINDLGKRNLLELFNNAKNDQFLNDSHKEKSDINSTNNINNMNNNININNINKTEPRNDIRKKNCNLQISHQFVFSSPRSIKKPKKIFECSGSTFATNNSNKEGHKKRRFRKNNEQLSLLKKFYNEHKYWSKSQIKEISRKIGLKENKVYKWLWDQRNKEIKATKFVVKKGNTQ